MEIDKSGVPIAQSIERLMNRVLLLVFIAAFIYLAVLKYYAPQDINLWLVSPFLFLPITIYSLNRFKQFNYSKFLGLLGYNIALFLAASSESSSTGLAMHFVSCCSIAVAIFSYRERGKSIFLVCLSVLLFISVRIFSFHFLPYRNYNPELEKIFFVIHILCVAIVSAYSFYTVVGVNYKAQQNMRSKQAIIETQNQELRKANQELDKFVYSASHDLRAPLTSIKGLVNLMEMDDLVARDEYVPKIKGQISKMETFMRDVVDYSRNSRQDVKLEEIDLFVMVNDIVKSLSFFDGAHAIVFEVNIKNDQLITSDEYRLGVILNNLISNSIKYANFKSDPFVKISYSENGNRNCITIEDNGIGIAEAHLPKIFDMFYRASTVSKGSGLGLYIAVESAQKLNYKINVSSKLNEGTTFIIEIPSAK